MSNRSSVDRSDSQTSTAQSTSISVSAMIACVILCAAFVGSEWRSWQWMFEIWMTNPDNSHGLLVPIFSAWLLYLRRPIRPANSTPITTVAFSLGVALILAAMAVHCSGIYCRMISVSAVSVLPCLAGIVLCCGGWPAARWAWPSVLFLVFMIPLPQSIGIQLGGTLQHVATIGSTYLLQLIGMPAVSEGNVIFLTKANLGVAEACSGIRMLMSFFALTTALCFLFERAAWEKALFWLSAPFIAVAANVLRITATGIAYEMGSDHLAELIFHDLAGWLMMPVGLALLGVESFLLAKVFPIVQQADLSNALLQPSRPVLRGA